MLRDVRDGDRWIHCTHDILEFKQVPPVPRKKLDHWVVQVAGGPQTLVHVEMVLEACPKRLTELTVVEADPNR